jgi:chromosome segregation ATPase
MKQILTKEDVSKAVNQLVALGKKPTLVALHAALDNKGSMSTLVRLRAEIDAEAQREADSPESLEAFRMIWSLASADGRREQEQAVAELRDSLRALATENERLEGIAAAATRRATELEEAETKTQDDLQLIRISAERSLGEATTTMRDAGIQAAKALQELADARAAHAAEVATLQAQLASAHRNAHSFELQLARAHTLLEANGLAGEKLPRS